MQTSIDAQTAASQPRGSFEIAPEKQGDAKQTSDLRRIKIPACEEHDGYYSLTLNVEWKCLICGGPRGEVFQTHSYDGSQRLDCDGWSNPCGHIEKYSLVREAAQKQGGTA